MIISQPKIPFLGVVFDVDHDFEGPRAPKAHLDTVNRNLLHHLAPPFNVGAARGAARHTRVARPLRDWARGGEPILNNPFQNPPHSSVLVGGVEQRRGARPRQVQTQCCRATVAYAAYFFSVQLTHSTQPVEKL